jgi:hypothetical protein
MKKYFHHAGYTPRMVTPDYMYNVYDRTGEMIDIPQIECISPIGKLVQPKTIAELCYDSTQNILKNAQSNQIYVTWSGGIDSTLVLSELLKHAPRDQLVVMMDDNSIKEYPEFYEKHVRDKLKTTTMDFYTDNPLKDAIKNGIVVTGHLMDPVFGANIYQAIPKEKLKQSIPEFLKSINKDSRLMYIKLISACPRPLQNIKDFFWWMDYTLNYQSEQLMWLLEVPDMILDVNLFHFGAGADWNNYAVSTPAEIKWPGYDFRKYKQVIKDQIFDFTKDEFYTTEKIKMPSWRHYRTSEQRHTDKAVWIDTDWKRGYLPPTFNF